jgi:hypothetical protein
MTRVLLRQKEQQKENLLYICHRIDLLASGAQTPSMNKKQPSSNAGLFN